MSLVSTTESARDWLNEIGQIVDEGVGIFKQVAQPFYPPERWPGVPTTQTPQATPSVTGQEIKPAAEPNKIVLLILALGGLYLLTR